MDSITHLKCAHCKKVAPLKWLQTREGTQFVGVIGWGQAYSLNYCEDCKPHDYGKQIRR